MSPDFIQNFFSKRQNNIAREKGETKMKKAFRTALTALMALSLVGCANEAKPEEQASEETTTDSAFAENFKTVSMENRPLTRWWVPGSQMDKDEIKKEIESMVNAGFGGAEVVPVSVAGGDGEGVLDWGSEHWKEVTKYMLEVAGENNFTIDFTMTPAWPLALPTIKNVDDPAEGAQMEMDGAWIDGITKNSPFSGTLPVSGEAVEDAKKVNGTAVLTGVSVAKYADKENKVLAYDSAKALDLAEMKDNGDGTYSCEFTPEDDGEYVIFAWYQHPSGNTKYENNQVDHYSKAGSRMIIDYWENELIPYYGEAFENCRSMFIDSLEFETHLDWTYGLQDSFKEANGYDVTAYLPAIYDGSDEWTAIGNYMGEPAPSFSFDQNSNELLNDFREHLTRLYIENNIEPLKEFCAKHNVTLRYQTSYGKSLDTAETAMYPDIPETESLYGNDYMDFYRLQAGAVHAADKKIYSMETSAEWTETWNPKKDNGEYGTRGNGEYNSGNYEQTFLDHIWHDQRAFASGVNQVVFHGYPYSGAYEGGAVEGTQWPGFTGFESYRWSNSWGERQPNWMFAKTYLDFIARNQYVLRQGTPKVDAAIYHHSYYETIDFWGPEKIFTTECLEQNGYSYDFVDPSVLDLDNMNVKDGVLDPEGAAYKALILDNETDLPAKTVAKLQSYADNGLTIVFIGETAAERTFMNDEDITSAMETLLASENVITIENDDETAAALKQAGVRPSASYENETLLAARRAEKGKDYYFLYNYGNANNYRDVQKAADVDAEITLEGNGTPYLMNAWTGETTPVKDFKAAEGSVTLNVHLAANDSMIIVLSDEVLAEAPAEAQAMEGSVELKEFTLSIESWTPGETVLDTVKTVIDAGTVSSLKTWDEINSEYTDISGVGTYKASFTADGFEEGQKAYLHLGRGHDAFGVKVNGKEIIVDQVSGDADISEAMKKGENEIEITVATSLLNAILKNNSSILNDEGRVLDDRSPASYGLREAVIINGNSIR